MFILFLGIRPKRKGIKRGIGREWETFFPPWINEAREWIILPFLTQILALPRLIYIYIYILNWLILRH